MTMLLATKLFVKDQPPFTDKTHGKELEILKNTLSTKLKNHHLTGDCLISIVYDLLLNTIQLSNIKIFTPDDCRRRHEMIIVYDTLKEHGISIRLVFGQNGEYPIIFGILVHGKTNKLYNSLHPFTESEFIALKDAIEAGAIPKGFVNYSVTIPENINLSPDERRVVEYIAYKKSIKRETVETLLGCKEDKAGNILKNLRETKIIDMRGIGKSTYYTLSDSLLPQSTPPTVTKDTTAVIEDDIESNNNSNNNNNELDKTAQSFCNMLKKGNVNAISLLVHHFKVIVSDNDYCYPKGIIDAALKANVEIAFANYQPDESKKILIVKHPCINNQSNQHFSSIVPINEFNKYIAAIQKDTLPKRMFLLHETFTN
jgi:hypothetical protein